MSDGARQTKIGFHWKNPLEGYRRLTFMMLDANIVAVSPASVWPFLKVERKAVEDGHGLRAASGLSSALAH
jgi:hypothetical protein